MKFEISFTQDAKNDITYFSAREQRIILDGIKRFLTTDADVISKRRKKLRENEIAPWALRIGDYRIFYDFEENNTVKIIAAGYKKHNDLYIQGKRVEI